MLKYIYKQITDPTTIQDLTRSSLSSLESRFGRSSDKIDQCPSGFLEVFLVHPYWGYRVRRGDLHALVSRLKRIGSELEKTKVFLSLSEAIQYARFMDDRHGILRAFVPDFAIEGRAQELALKKEYFNHHFIHGCYPIPQQKKFYIKVPSFSLPILV